MLFLSLAFFSPPLSLSPGRRRNVSRRALATFPGSLSLTAPDAAASLGRSRSGDFGRALAAARSQPGTFFFRRRRPSAAGQRHPLHRSPLANFSRRRLFSPGRRQRRRLRRRRPPFSGRNVHRESGQNLPSPEAYSPAFVGAPRGPEALGTISLAQRQPNSPALRHSLAPARNRRRGKRPRQRRLSDAADNTLRLPRTPFLFRVFGQRSPLGEEGLYPEPLASGPGGDHHINAATRLTAPAMPRTASHRRQLLAVLALRQLPRQRAQSGRLRPVLPTAPKLALRRQLTLPGLLPPVALRRQLRPWLAAALPTLVRQRCTKRARTLVRALARRRPRQNHPSLPRDGTPAKAQVRVWTKGRVEATLAKAKLSAQALIRTEIQAAARGNKRNANLRTPKAKVRTSTKASAGTKARRSKRAKASLQAKAPAGAKTLARAGAKGRAKTPVTLRRQAAAKVPSHRENRGSRFKGLRPSRGRHSRRPVLQVLPHLVARRRSRLCRVPSPDMGSPARNLTPRQGLLSGSPWRRRHSQGQGKLRLSRRPGPRRFRAFLPKLFL